MATSNVYLQGGPCDGRTVSADQIVGGLVAYIKCGGGFYVLAEGVTRPNGDIVFKYSGTTAPQPPGDVNAHTPKALEGWAALRKSFNHDMPKALAASHHSGDAALRSLRRARKLRL